MQNRTHKMIWVDEGVIYTLRAIFVHSRACGIMT